MKNRKFLAAMTALCFLGIATSAMAQVYVEFAAPQKVGNRPYTPFSGAGTVVHSRNDFSEIIPPTVNYDYGYKIIDLPFAFEFNTVQYNKIAVNVNGFVLFVPDGNTPQLTGIENPTSLFTGGITAPNVVAPFWGDHFYRLNEFQYMPSQIVTKDEVIPARSGVVGATERRFGVEWRNININNETLPSSVGNFQVFFYQANNGIPGNAQGDIEFAYGQVGGNTATPLNTVVTRDAAVGIKGTSSVSADFINGLWFNNQDSARRSTRLTNNWQPSGGSDTIILFSAKPRLRAGRWGDGDVDFSSAVTGKHFGMSQTRFVTANDAMRILRSVATNIPLDSTYQGSAYRGDVDHNGRYYYSNWSSSNIFDGINRRKEITFREPSEGDTAYRIFPFPTVPADNGRDPFAIYFQVNSYDAALILHFLGGRIIQLPWVLDSIVPFGKVGQNVAANSFEFGSATHISQNTYTVPVYLNGYRNGATSIVFEANGTIESVQTQNGEMLNVSNGNKVAIAGSVHADASTPVAYVTIKTSSDELVLSNTEFNGNAVSGTTIKLQNAETNSVEGFNAVPNPFGQSTTINVAIPQTGKYSVSIFDMVGNKVASLFEGNVEKGARSFEWNGTDINGQLLSSGMYLCKVEGNGSTTVNKVVIAR